MTTPLGTLEVIERQGRRVSVARRTRETDIHVVLDIDGTGQAAIDTGVGFYDHLLGSLAHHGLFDLDVKATGDLHIDEHHTVEDVALVIGAAFAEALGDRAGIRRFGDSSVPMDESVATAVIDVGGRPYAVIDLPFRVGASRGAAAATGGPCPGVIRANPRRHAPPERDRSQRPSPGGGRVQGAGPGAPGRVRARSPADRRGVDEGLPRVTMASGAPRVVVVDYGAGNLVSIEQALTAAGASVDRAMTGADIGDPDLLVVPGVGAAAPAMDRLREDGFIDPIRAWIDADRPFLGICLGLQLLYEGSDEDGAETLGILPGRTVRLERAPTLPHIGWNQVVRRRAHAAFAGIADDADFYFVHSLRRSARTVRLAGELILADTTHGSPFASAVARGRLLGVQFHPERSGTDGLRLIANVVALARAAAGSLA